MQKIATDHLYHLTINSEYIPLSNDVIVEIIKAVAIDMIANAPTVLSHFSMDTLYREIDWRWMADRGTLVRRISKWFYEHKLTAVSPVGLSAVGNIVRKHIVKNQEYHIDFTNKFDWRAGQFADSGSCFWDGREAIRGNMEKSGKFLAVRFFREEDHGTFIKGVARVDTKLSRFYAKDDRYTYTGIARAWICQENITHKGVTSPVWIVFNGYGIATKQIATIVAAFHNQSIKKIAITNNGSKHGGLYTNGDGYLVGPESLIKDKETYDFGVPFRNEIPVSKASTFETTKLEARKKSPIEVRFDAARRQRAFLEGMDAIFAQRHDGGLLQYIPDEPFHVPAQPHEQWV